MPVRMQQLPGGGYRVSTPGGVKAKHTTKKKAKAQKRLLNAVEHGYQPGGRRKVRHSPEMEEIDHQKIHGQKETIG